MLLRTGNSNSNFDESRPPSEIPSLQNQTANQSWLGPVDQSNIMMSNMMPSTDASFVGEVQHLINAPSYNAANDNNKPLVKNQLFYYQSPYPNNLP